MAAFDPERGKSKAARTVSMLAAGGKAGPTSSSSIGLGDRLSRCLKDGRSGLGSCSEASGNAGGRFDNFSALIEFELAAVARELGLMYSCFRPVDVVGWAKGRRCEGGGANTVFTVTGFSACNVPLCPKC